MSVQPGTQLGSYRILSLLGAGGMGEVYQARDTRLGRDVALKVLPESFVGDENRRARLIREAQLLASLSHPNIAAIYGMEESGSGSVLVLEYIDGETLAEHIAKGPMPLEDVVTIALQISEALEAAHEKGVIHRDLKPANIKITAKGSVKVLDFGLAKLLQEDLATASLTNSPTMSDAATRMGVILGTAGYMAPEQARGKNVDRRADIWAFGVVLFEMLSARRVFGGDTVAETLAKVLEREPDWSNLPAGTPAPLRSLLRRCLVKVPHNRLQAIGDARTALQEFIADPHPPEAVPVTIATPRWKKLLPWALAPVALAAGLLWRTNSPEPVPAVEQFEYSLPAGQTLNYFNRHALALSRDGRLLAYVAGAANGPGRLFVKSLERWDTVEIPGTEDAQDPVFSANGQELAWVQNAKIRRVNLSGGSPATILAGINENETVYLGEGGITWGNGQFVYAGVLSSGLKSVPDGGGDVREFTQLDGKANEVSHRLPHFLPDGSAVLFTVLRYTSVTPNWSKAQIWVKSIKTGEKKWLLDDGMDARYAGHNTLVFIRQGKLFAVHFDPISLSITGKPVLVLDGVVHSLYGRAGIAWTGAGQYSVSENGSLLYASGSFEPPLKSNLVWVDRHGTPTPIPISEARSRFAPRILPDGRIAYSELYVNKDIWLFNPANGIEERRTFEGQNSFPILNPKQALLAFRSDRLGALRIFFSPEANPKEATVVTEGGLDVPSSWSADGKELAFTRPGRRTDIFAVSASAPHTIRPLVATEYDERFPEFSPDGNWLAYCSNESGSLELYVQPYPGPGKPVKLTDGGAQEPAFSKTTNEIFYTVGRQMMSIRYKVTKGEFIAERAERVFEWPFALNGGATVRIVYDISTDGRFLMPMANQESAAEFGRKMSPTAFRMIQNWTTALRDGEGNIRIIGR